MERRRALAQLPVYLLALKWTELPCRQREVCRFKYTRQRYGIEYIEPESEPDFILEENVVPLRVASPWEIIRRKFRYFVRNMSFAFVSMWFRFHLLYFFLLLFFTCISMLSISMMVDIKTTFIERKSWCNFFHFLIWFLKFPYFEIMHNKFMLR